MDFDAWYLRNGSHIVDPARSARLAWFAALAATPVAVEGVREPSSEWVSVADRLPEFDLPVWVGWDGSNTRRPAVENGACFRFDDADGWLWSDAEFGSTIEWDTDEMPTHWMPLPWNECLDALATQERAAPAFDLAHPDSIVHELGGTPNDDCGHGGAS